MSISQYLENAVIYNLQNNPNIDFLKNYYPDVSPMIQDDIIRLLCERQFFFTREMKERIMSKPIYYWLQPGTPREQGIIANKMHHASYLFMKDFFNITGYQTLIKDLLLTIPASDIFSLLREIHIDVYLEDEDIKTIIIQRISEFFLQEISLFEILDTDAVDKFFSDIYDLLYDIDVILSGCSDNIKKPFFTGIFQAFMTNKIFLKDFLVWNDGQVIQNYMIKVIDDHLLHDIFTNYSINLNSQFRIFEHLKSLFPIKDMELPYHNNLSDFVRLLKNIGPQARKIRLEFIDLHLLTLLKKDMTLLDACFFCRFFMGSTLIYGFNTSIPKFQHLEKFGINAINDIIVPVLSCLENNKLEDVKSNIFMPLASRLYDIVENKDALTLFSQGHPLNFAISTEYHFDKVGNIVQGEIRKDIDFEEVNSLYSIWRDVIEQKNNNTTELPIMI